MDLTSVGGSEEVAGREGRHVRLKKAAQNQAPSRLKAQTPTLPNASSLGKNGLIEYRVRQLPIRTAKASGTRFLHNRSSLVHSGNQDYGGNE